MGVVYSWAGPDVRKAAEELIEEYHPELAELEVRYVFRSKHARSKGRVVGGKARVVSSLGAFLIDGSAAVPVIELAADVWGGLSAERRRALLDHELTHFVLDEGDESRVLLRGHDVEEFAEIVGRHGLWTPDLESLHAAAPRQERLRPVDEG